MLYSPLLHQFIVANCSFQAQVAIVESGGNIKSIDNRHKMGIWSPIWPLILLPGILALVSVLFNFSLILVSFTKIKDHKVCNWLLAFDSFCQLFFVVPFLVNFLASVLQYTTVDYRICAGTLMVSTLASYASFLAIYLISAERLLIVLFPIKMNWIKEQTIQRFSLFFSLFSILFGVIMVFNIYGEFTIITTNFERFVFCNSGLYMDVLNANVSIIILSLCVLNYVGISIKILWRYVKFQLKKTNNLATIVPTSDHSMRRMLRSVFLLSSVILIGWLIGTVFRNLLIFLLFKLINSLFGGDKSQEASFIQNLSTVSSVLLTSIPILASASGAPILMLSQNYREAYKKLLKRNSPSAVGPLFTN
ncbi:hypothetical protein niasHS_003161 [Heterodera schachtii]|uniref:G-protein coupled receptors family 1 profile domain-containing protein n=1 Tax=Heterodera schachtii TaxID=97005 RepID=A0ABD2KA04_HETSC